LDGTTNFIHGVPTFAVSIGLTDEIGLVAGSVFDPCRDEMFHARRGGGAFLNGAPISCTQVDELDAALIATGFPFRELDRLDAYLDAFERFVRATSGIRRAGAASLDLAYTACGRYDGFFEIGLSPWDLAGGRVARRGSGGPRDRRARGFGVPDVGIDRGGRIAAACRDALDHQRRALRILGILVSAVAAARRLLLPACTCT
jgi:fructose-1,6-bisphosphatase/inositol monophosphatase family enzyme